MQLYKKSRKKIPVSFYHDYFLKAFDKKKTINNNYISIIFKDNISTSTEKKKFKRSHAKLILKDLYAVINQHIL